MSGIAVNVVQSQLGHCGKGQELEGQSGNYYSHPRERC